MLQARRQGAVKRDIQSVAKSPGAPKELSVETSLRPGLSSEDAAVILNTTPATLADLRWRGRGPPFIRRGRRVFYLEEDLKAFLDENRCRSTSNNPNAERPHAP